MPDLAGEAPLSIAHLVAGYGERTVLDDVSFALNRAEIAVVLGGSGCGKSTLLRHAIGQLTPISGRVVVLGQDLATADEASMRTMRRRIGVLFQSGALLGDLNVEDNVMLPMRMLAGWPLDVCRQVASTKLQWLGLAHAARLLPAELSGGMRKRAALARALALEPELLCIDEPSAGLDPITAAELDALLLRTRDTFGTSMLVVTHELASIQVLADRVLMLANGKALASGSLEEVLASRDARVQAFFARRATTTPMDTASADGAPGSLLAALQSASSNTLAR